MDRNLLFKILVESQRQSLSARRAWIEIKKSIDKYVYVWSLSARRAWIEILLVQGHRSRILSLSARRAWIEIELA